MKKTILTLATIALALTLGALILPGSLGYASQKATSKASSFLDKRPTNPKVQQLALQKTVLPWNSQTYYSKITSNSTWKNAKRRGGYSSNPIVNVAFFKDPKLQFQPRLAFDTPLLIQSIYSPKTSADSLLKNIIYEVIEEDTDSNETLNSYDDKSIYITDLEGDSLKRITPLGINVVSYQFENNKQDLMIRATQVVDSLKNQRIFWFNFETQKTTEMKDVIHLLTKAKDILPLKNDSL